MDIDIEKRLNINNIDKNISIYLNSIKEMETSISANNIIKLLKFIKRDDIGKGPYKNVAFFEAANRIMTDLVILYGINDLLNGKYKEINFPEYIVEYGNDHNNDFDITAENNGIKLIGEAFNVSKSFFQGKKSKAIGKLRNYKCKNEKLIKILMYNNDAVDVGYNPKPRSNEYHIIVEIPQ
ncbi:MAG: hypothetical protein LBC52_01795 [Treponema sp.]|jgi:hypothetical protein|nr:hypothetical protein [Treponema sp.]